MKLRIQQHLLSNGTLPYPYFVEENGDIGRQDFWKGNPKKFIGFSKKPVAGEIEYPLIRYQHVDPRPDVKDFYPVFERENGEWYTDLNTVNIVTERE